MPQAPMKSADAIVALTGDEERISKAVQLLSEGRAQRLLISGVNKTTRTPDLVSLNSASWRETFFFYCCVDLDKRALNTEDNALETTLWVRERGFRSLIVVTSNYHMPRTLIELHQTMPEVKLIPCPVRSQRLETQWWADARTAWHLGKEYMKFVTALARYTANSLTRGSTGGNPSRIVNARMG
jgi:uncharacterized SAM-binding protein YcdF (DUF218 family)